jgi:uncharacterized protein YrrD
MLFSENTGRSVVSVADATTVGVVDGFVVDPAVARVVALRLRKTKDARNLLAWPRIHAMGEDAVMVASGDALEGREASSLGELADERHSLPGKRILSERGNELGAVSDVDFDPETGSVLSLITAQGQIAGKEMVGVGSYAVVVHESASPRPQESQPE